MFDVDDLTDANGLQDGRIESAAYRSQKNNFVDANSDNKMLNDMVYNSSVGSASRVAMVDEMFFDVTRVMVMKKPMILPCSPIDAERSKDGI